MRILELFDDFHVPYVTEGHKHCRPGWVNVECPFCTGNPGYHLGFNLDSNYFHCWRCGGKNAEKVLSSLLNMKEYQVKEVITKYGGISKQRPTKEPVVKIKLKKLKYPVPTTPLQRQHELYLIKRKFDPEYLQQEWGLLGTGPISMLDSINYGHRVLAPVTWNNEVVTFQCRDITNRHPLKYMACPKERETIHHKHILYGKQSEWKSTGICVEGITDVWRLGVLSFAVFGIEFKMEQVREIAHHFRRVAVMFDGGEEQARTQAMKMVGKLKQFNVEAFRVDITGDPADMIQSEADYLVKQIIS